MTKEKYIVTCSGGNDSVALIQHMLNIKANFAVVYNNTGWAVDWWATRMAVIEDWLINNNIGFYETKADFKELVRKKGAFPQASRQQFCTENLKIKPSLELYEIIDPDIECVIVTGRRREESRNRRDLPEWVEESPVHGGRDVWNPIIMLNEAQRDLLIDKTPLPKLATQSLECYPCINANKKSTVLRELPESRINEIEDFELSLGRNGKGNPRTMFRPYRAGGAIGIKQVVEWAKGKRGHKVESQPEKYLNTPVIMGGEELDVDIPYPKTKCNSGFCGE